LNSRTTGGGGAIYAWLMHMFGRTAVTVAPAVAATKDPAIYIGEGVNASSKSSSSAEVMKEVAGADGSKMPDPNDDKNGNKKNNEIGKKKLDHVLKDHTYGRMKNTINKLMEKGLTETAEKLLNKKSFFNPSWSEQKVIEATKQAYNRLLSQGFTHGTRTVTVFGEDVTVNVENGFLHSAYGNYRFTLSDFGF